MKKNIIIIILGVLVVGLGGYMIYDKVINKGVNEENNMNENTNSESTDQIEELTFIKKINKDVSDEELIEYLKYFMPSTLVTAPHTSERTEKMVDNEFINEFVYYAINHLIRTNEIEYIEVSEDENGNYMIPEYTIDKKYVKALVDIYFDVKEYTIDYKTARGYGIFDLGNDKYKFTYQPTGWYAPKGVFKSRDNNSIEFELYNTIGDEEYTGNYKIYYTYKDNTYKVTKLEFIKK